MSVSSNREIGLVWGLSGPLATCAIPVKLENLHTARLDKMVGFWEAFKNRTMVGTLARMWSMRNLFLKSLITCP